MKRTFGIILLVLSGLFFLSAINTVGKRLPDEERDPGFVVGYSVGAFLPSLICAIVGLVLISTKKPRVEDRTAEFDRLERDDYDASPRSVRSDAIAAEPRGSSDDPEAPIRSARSAARSTPSIAREDARAEQFKWRSNICVALAIVLTGAALVLVRQGPEMITTSRILGLVGGGLMIWGCVDYARWKGRSGWWGFLGILSIIGLIVLVCLPNRRKWLHQSSPDYKALDGLAAYDRIPGYRYLLTLLLPGLASLGAIMLPVAPVAVPAAEWEELARPDLNFKLMMPGKPKFQGDTKKTPAGDIELHKFIVARSFRNEAFLIVSTRMPQNVAVMMGGPKKLLEVGREDIAQAAKGQVKNERPVQQDELEGIAFDVFPPRGEIVKARVFATNNQIIEIAAFVSQDRGESDDVRKFLDSLKLTVEPAPVRKGKK